MVVSQEIQKLVEDRLHEVIARVEATFNRKFEFPAIDYKLKGRVAGQAFYSQHSVSFNAALLVANVVEFVRDTVPHEMAHLVTGIVYPHTKRTRQSEGSPHGIEWRYVMHTMGIVDVTRCHQYDTSETRILKSTSRIYDGKCVGCGFVYKLSEKQIKQLALEPGKYICTRSMCRSAVVADAQVAEKLTAPVAADKQANPYAAGTSAHACWKIFIANQHLARKDVIRKFVDQTGMSPAGASTYYQNCRSKLK